MTQATPQASVKQFAIDNAAHERAAAAIDSSQLSVGEGRDRPANSTTPSHMQGSNAGATAKLERDGPDDLIGRDETPFNFFQFIDWRPLLAKLISLETLVDSETNNWVHFVSLPKAVPIPESETPLLRL